MRVVIRVWIEKAEGKNQQRLMAETVSLVQGKTRLHMKDRKIELIGILQTPNYGKEE